MLVLPRNLAGLAKFASGEAGRYPACHGVKVLDKDDGTYEAVATDASRCMIVRGACPWEQVTAAFAQYADMSDDFQIPLAQWKQAFKIPGAEGLTLQGKGGDYVFGTTNGFVDGVQQEGRYPSYRDVFPTHRPPLASVRVNPKLLADMLLYLAQVNDYEQGVTLVIWPRCPLLGVLSKNDATRQAFDGLLMGLGDGAKGVTP